MGVGAAHGGAAQSMRNQAWEAWPHGRFVSATRTPYCREAHLQHARKGKSASVAMESRTSSSADAGGTRCGGGASGLKPADGAMKKLGTGGAISPSAPSRPQHPAPAEATTSTLAPVSHRMCLHDRACHNGRPRPARPQLGWGTAASPPPPSGLAGTAPAGEQPTSVLPESSPYAKLEQGCSRSIP